MILAIDTAQMTYSAALSNEWYTEWDDIQLSLYHILKDVNLNQLTGIIINVGPGRFSGVRSGLAFAKGLAHAKNIPLYAATHFEAIAYKSNKDGLHIALDARKQEAYTQSFSEQKATSDIQIQPISSLNSQDVCGNIIGELVSINAKDLLPLVDIITPKPPQDIQAIYIRPATD